MDIRPMGGSVVRAAGGVVWRPDDLHVRTYAVVHRPEYDDWSLPKGKVMPGETEEAAALREVLEETGTRCRLERDLGTTSYVDRKGRPKIVYYWLMRVLDGVFVPHEEIDEVRWLPFDAALELLSYDRDRVLLRGVVDTPRRRPAEAS